MEAMVENTLGEAALGRVLAQRGALATWSVRSRGLPPLALQEELTLKLLTDMMVKEAAAAEARSPPASLSPGHD